MHHSLNLIQKQKKKNRNQCGVDGGMIPTRKMVEDIKNVFGKSKFMSATKKYICFYILERHSFITTPTTSILFTDTSFAEVFDSHLRGPGFVMEPPPRLEFSNSSGGWLDCSASGSPQPTIDWLSVDGTSVGDVGGIRRVLRNGTLVLLPFAAAAYRQDIHNTIYRCVASNTVGRVISRDVQVRAEDRTDLNQNGFRK
ncbi:Down syndrome cell adhesion molecule-like protein Dscam2 [Pseudolycoriella hygida]|uniref:Down syndrome cell adhesion molecule-like protein Dscam2 n=1 Tax=Pseudolycoriella hygida TaxID=35572 RepID=A0A9Q0S3I2_9DIPT|nr:Down syndrome cell adhesion molecule-like protein Dscam2 [Pseudolycoriella hygida]